MYIISRVLHFLFYINYTVYLPLNITFRKKIILEKLFAIFNIHLADTSILYYFFVGFIRHGQE